MVKLGGRKFVGFVLVLATGVTLHVLNKPLTTELVAFLVAMYGAFSASNVVATLSALKNGGQAGAQTDGAISDRLARIEGVLSAATDPAEQAKAEATIARIENGLALQNQAIGEVLKRLAPRQ